MSPHAYKHTTYICMCKQCFPRSPRDNYLFSAPPTDDSVQLGRNCMSVNILLIFSLDMALLWIDIWEYIICCSHWIYLLSTLFFHFSLKLSSLIFYWIYLLTLLVVRKFKNRYGIHIFLPSLIHRHAVLLGESPAPLRRGQEHDGDPHVPSRGRAAGSHLRVEARGAAHHAPRRREWCGGRGRHGRRTSQTHPQPDWPDPGSPARTRALGDPCPSTLRGPSAGVVGRDVEGGSRLEWGSPEPSAGPRQPHSVGGLHHAHCARPDHLLRPQSRRTH